MKKRGISLITLVITIVVVIILAAAVILSLSQNNPIGQSRVAQVTQTRDSLQSGILIYTSNEQAKNLGSNSTKQILIGGENVGVANDDVTNTQVPKNGKTISLYKLDYDKVKYKLKIDLVKNDSPAWYIDEYGFVYLVYDTSEAIPSYYKENGKIMNTLSNFVVAKDSDDNEHESNQGNPDNPDTPDVPVITSYTVSYNANGGTGEMSSSSGSSITIAENGFTAPSGKVFNGWNTAQDGSGTAYEVGTQVSLNLELYAIWRNVTYEAFEVGDEVTILNGETAETFFVIKNSGINEDKVTVITKENVDTEATPMVQSTSIKYTRFSDGIYWWDSAHSEVYSTYTGVNELNVDILGSNSLQQSDGKYALYGAQEYGKAVGGTGRLLLKSEADILASSNPALLYGNSGKYQSTTALDNYWLASLEEGYEQWGYIWIVYSSGTRITDSKNGILNGKLRPVVEISKDLVTKVTE